MWSTVTPTSAAAATTLALLEEYVIFNLTADSSGQLYTKTGGNGTEGGGREEGEGEYIYLSDQITRTDTFTRKSCTACDYTTDRTGTLGGREGNHLELVWRLLLSFREEWTPAQLKPVTLKENEEMQYRRKEYRQFEGKRNEAKLCEKQRVHATLSTAGPHREQCNARIYGPVH